MSPATSTTTDDAPGWRTALLAIGAVGLFGLTYGPLLWEFAVDLWSRPYYQHFPYVLLAAGILIYEQVKTAPGAEPSERAWLPAILLVAAWLVLALAVFALWPLLAAISAVLLIGGLLAVLCRRLGRRFPTGPWLLLWLIIPPPVGLDGRLLTKLQLISSDLASKALDLFGVGHLMEGNVLILPTKQLFVDEACSGIISVISLSTCAAIYAVWQRRPLVHIVLLMVAAVGWAVLLNVVRIVTIALAEANAGVDLAEGVAHTLLGLAIFAINVLAVIALDWLLHALLAEIDQSEVAATDAPLLAGGGLIAMWNRVMGDPPADLDAPNDIAPLLRPTLSWVSLLVAASFAAVGLGQIVLPNTVDAARIEASKLPVEQVISSLLEPGVMPDKIGDLQLVDVQHVQRGQDDSFGKNSVIWEYRDASDQEYLLSCDLPFRDGWHELSSCYAGIGWEIAEREKHPLPADDGLAVTLSLRKNDSHCVVSFCGCYANGEVVRPPFHYGSIWLAMRRLQYRDELVAEREFFQLQVKTEHNELSDAETAENSLELLSKLRRHVVAKLEQNLDMLRQ